VRVKVRAVILDRGNVLVVSQRRAGAHSHYALPGGRVGRGESVADALVREIREEVDLEIAPRQLLCVADVNRPHGEQDLVLVFLAEPIGLSGPGDLRLLDRVAADHAPGLLVDLAAAVQVRVLPPIVAEIARDRDLGWSKTPRWLGDVWLAPPPPEEEADGAEGPQEKAEEEEEVRHG
jgi:ADP-ribose pyrophosphatase YjhB (NUDIX family)